jgi:hypothetical protein
MTGRGDAKKRAFSGVTTPDASCAMRTLPAKTGTTQSNSKPIGTSHCDDKIFIQSPVQIKDVTGFLFPNCAMDKHLAHVVFVIGSKLLLGEGCPKRQISLGATVEHRTI